jgi:hypothetical protein
MPAITRLIMSLRDRASENIFRRLINISLLLHANAQDQFDIAHRNYEKSKEKGVFVVHLVGPDYQESEVAIYKTISEIDNDSNEIVRNNKGIADYDPEQQFMVMFFIECAKSQEYVVMNLAVDRDGEKHMTEDERKLLESQMHGRTKTTTANKVIDSQNCNNKECGKAIGDKNLPVVCKGCTLRFYCCRTCRKHDGAQHKAVCVELQRRYGKLIEMRRSMYDEDAAKMLGSKAGEVAAIAEAELGTNPGENAAAEATPPSMPVVDTPDHVAQAAAQLLGDEQVVCAQEDDNESLSDVHEELY